MTDRDPADTHDASAPDRGGDDGRDLLPGTGFQRRRGRRFQVPWWVLTLAGAGVGFVAAEWIGMAFGGILGFFAWRLR